MATPNKSTPILPRPHWIRGTGNVRIAGSGEATIEVSGARRISLHLSGRMQFAFDGEAIRRLPCSERIDLLDPKGTLTVQGEGVEVELADATVLAGVVGRFDVMLDGRGEVETAAGARLGWGLHPKSLAIDGAACREKGHTATTPRGGMAA